MILVNGSYINIVKTVTRLQRVNDFESDTSVTRMVKHFEGKMFISFCDFNLKNKSTENKMKYPIRLLGRYSYLVENQLHRRVNLNLAPSEANSTSFQIDIFTVW